MTVKELFYSNLDRLACRSSSVVFLREESLVLFVAARPVWNVVLFSSGRKVFCLNRLSPFDEFGTLCRFLREERLCLFIITQLDVLFDFPPLDEFRTSCRFFNGHILLFVLFIVARRTWNVVLFSSGRKLTLFAFDCSN